MELPSSDSVTSLGYSHLDLLALSPTQREDCGSYEAFIMGKAEAPSPIGKHDVQKLVIPTDFPSQLEETITRLVEEKRVDLLVLASGGNIEGKFEGHPEIRVHNKAAFNKQVQEISAHISGEDPNKVKALVTQRCLQELWPVLCLEESRKRLEVTHDGLEKRVCAVPKGKISKQVNGAVKTTSIFLKEVEKLETLSKTTIEEKVWEAQKLLAKSESLQSQLNRLETPSNEKTVRHDVEKLEVGVTQFLEDGRGDKEYQSSWLGSLFDRGAAWVKWLTPKSIQNVVSASSQWLANGVQVPQEERDRADFHFLQRYQGKIDALHEKAQVLTDQIAQLKSKPALEKLKKLTQTIKQYHDVTEYLDDYFVLDEAQQAATMRVTDQRDRLEQGGCDFSADAYVGMIHQVQRFKGIGDQHKKQTKQKQLIDEIDKKTAYQNQQCLRHLEDFMGELLPAMRAESVEAIAQWDAAYKQWRNVASPENYSALLDAHLAREAVTRAIVAFSEKLEALGNEQLPDVYLTKCQSDLQEVRKLQRELMSIPAAPEEIVAKTAETLRRNDISEHLNMIRANRTPISQVQKTREWQQREFEKLEQEGPPSRQLFLRSFFFYLQALAPVVEVFSTPIAKQDFDFCLRMMAKTSETANPTGESYDHYLNMARGFIGADTEFLNSYDQFLRGQMQFTYNPAPTPTTAPAGMLPAGQKSTTEQIHKWVEGVAPSGIAVWTASFLGLTPEGQAAPQASAWDQWVQSAIYPQVKDNYFSGVVNYFEQLGSSTQPPADGDAALFGYHCYQMYESLKTSEGQQAFQTHWQQAAQFPQFRTFLKDFQEYLQTHTPRMRVETAPVKEPLENAVVLALPQAKNNISLPQGEHSVVGIAAKTNNVFEASPIAKGLRFGRAEGKINEEGRIPTNIIYQVPSENGMDHQTLSPSEQKAKAEDLQHLVEGPPLVSEKDLLHVIGDPFGLDTGLEGSNPAAGLKFRLGLLHAKLNALEDPHNVNDIFEWAGLQQTEENQSEETLRRLINQLQQSLTLYETLHRQDFPVHLAKALREAKLNEPVLLPGGWAGTPEGHGIYYEFTKQEDDRFAVRIYNTGAGINYHPMHAEQFKSKAVTFIEKVNVPLENIVDPFFVRALQELENLPPDGITWNEDDVYVTILTALGGDLNPITYTVDDLRTPQRAGTCAFMSLATALSYRMDSLNSFLRFEFEGELKALVDYSRANQSRIEQGEEVPWRLVSKSLAEFSRDVLEFHERGVINDEEKIFAAGKVRELQEMVIKGQNHILAQSRDTAPIANLDIVGSSLKLGKPTNVEVIETPSMELLEATITPEIISIKDWSPAPATLQTDLANFSTDMQAAFSKKDYTGVLATLDTIAERLPFTHYIPGDEFDSWKELSWDQFGLWSGLNWETSEAIIHSLAAMSKLAYQSQLLLTRVDPTHLNELSPKRLVNFFKLLTIAQRLATNPNAPFRAPRDSFMSFTAGHYITKPSLYFRTYDPSTDHDIQQLALYWDKSRFDNANAPKLSLPRLVEFEDYGYGFLDAPDFQTRLYDGDWLKHMVSAPSIRDAFNSRFPEYANEHEGERLAISLGDTVSTQTNTVKNERDLLPQFFYDLRDLMYLNHFLAERKLEISGESEKPFEFTYQAYKGGWGWKNWPLNPPERRKQSERLHSFNILQQASLNAAHSFIKNKHLYKLVTAGDPDHFERNQFYKDVDVPFSDWPVPLEERRHLANLVTNPALQVKETLVYFMSPLRAQLLTQPDYQVLFNSLFFEPGLLLQELQGPQKDVENFIQTTANFFQSRYNTYAQIGKWQEASFYLSQNRQFKAYVDYCVEYQGLKLSTPPVMLDPLVEIPAILKNQKAISDDGITFLNLELALAYENISKLETAEDAAQFLSAVISYDLRRGFLDHLPGREKELLLESVIGQFREDLFRHFSGPERDSLLNGIAKSTSDGFKEQSWSPYPAFPRFILEDKSRAIDVLEGKLYKATGKDVHLSPTITRNHLFEKVFGKDFNPKAGQVGAQTFEFFGPDSNTYRVSKVGSDLVIQRLVERQDKPLWYRLVAKKDLNAQTSANPALILDNTHWYSNAADEMLIYRPDAAAPSYQVKRTPEGDFQATLLNSTGAATTGLTLSDVPMPFLSGFEHPDFVLKWISRDGKPEALELPRFNLNFTIKEVQGSKRAFCDKMPGYSLATKQWIPALGDYPNCLVLEKASGEQKVLIPHHALTGDKNRMGSLETRKMAPDRDLKNPSQIFHEYAVNPLTGQLIPSSDLGRFYLGMVQLWRMDYSQAMTSLRGYEASLRPFNSEEIALLTQIANLKDASKDNDPRALVVYLYAAYLLKKNAIDFPGANAVPFELPKDLMLQYLSVAEKTAEVSLKPQEEALILYGNTSSIIDQYRLHQLVQASNLNDILHLPEVASSVPTGQQAIPKIDQIIDVPLLRHQGAPFLARVASSEQNTVPPSILNPPFVNDFSTFYKMAKGDLSNEEFQAAYYRLTGVSLPSSENLNQRGLMRTLFQMAQEGTLRQSQDDPKVALSILRIVNEDPSSFPDFDNIAKKTSRWDLSEVYEKTIISPAMPIAKALNIRSRSNAMLGGASEGTFVATQPPVPKHVDMPFEQCVAPYAISNLAQPVLKDLSSCIDVTSLATSPMDDVYSDLNAVFDIPNLDRVANREFKSIQDNLSTYSERDTASELYTLFDPLAFAKIHGDLETTIVQGSQSLLEKGATILNMANKRPSTELGGAHRVLEAVGEGKTDLTIDQLTNLFLLGDVDRFHQANPELTEEDIYFLNHSIMEYLVQSTHVQHLSRLATQMKGIQHAISEGISEGDLNQKLQDFSTAAASRRAYNAEEHPEYLVMEHYMDILMRADQVANIDLLRIHDGKIDNPDQIGVVLEMIMGAGKTDVLLPILGQLNADGDALSIGILPEALLPSMVQRLVERLGTSFEQSVDVLVYSRDQNFDKDDLTMLKWRLEHIRTERRMLFMTPSTLHSLFLSFVEAWREYAIAEPDKANELGEKLDLLRDIFRLFQDKGRVILDESDIILNSRTEHRFTSGGPLSLPTDQIDLSCSLYQMLLDPAIVGDMHFDFVEGNLEAPPFIPQDYREKVAPRLVETILQRKLGVSDPIIEEFFNGLTDEQRGYLTSYLSAKKEPDAIAFVSQISQPLLKDLLALAKEQINVLIPLTANKLVDEYYGASQNAVVPIAIPYHGSNNPAEKSRFGEYETLNYSIQLNLRKGVSTTVVKQEIEELQHEALELNNRGKAYLGSDTHKKFLQITGGDPQFHLFASDQETEELTKSINKSTDSKIYFAKKYSLPYIASHPITYSSNPQLFNFLFAKVFGFSGRLWNKDTFPDKLQVIGSDVATAKTLTLLWKNSHDQVYVLPKLDPAHLAEGLIGNNPELQDAHAVIDTAADGRGISNESHAKQLLSLPANAQREPPINGVVFYDEQDRLLILERGEDKPKRFELTTLPVEQRCTFYDQKHTTGSDIKQPFGASAVVTIGKNTILRDLLQSVWRMRGLDRGQHVKFVIDEEVKQVLIPTLERITGQKVTEPIELRHLLLFVTYNQAIQQGDNNFRSLKQKMKAILQETVLLTALDKKVDVANLKDMFKEVEELFVTYGTTSPWEMFGLPQEERDSEEVVEDLVNKTLESKAYKALTTDPTLASAVDAAIVEEKLHSLAEKSLPTLPDQLPVVDRRYGLEAEQETEKEKESEREVETEMEKDTSSYGQDHYRFEPYIPPAQADIHQWSFFSESDLKKISEQVNIAGVTKIKLPFISLDQAFANEPDLGEFATVFDSNVIASMQLIRQPEKISLLDFFQRDCGDILIVQNKASGDLKFVLMDTVDALNFRILLENDAKTMKRKGETRLCLYRPGGLGQYRQGNDRMDITALEKDPEFLRLLVQAKFFGGEVEYTEAEIPLLEAWIKTHGAIKMERLFNRIVEWKKTTREALPNSTLGTIFQELGAIPKA